jgi:hypothetical protein
MYAMCLETSECGWVEYTQEEIEGPCPACFSPIVLYTDDYWLNLRTFGPAPHGPGALTGGADGTSLKDMGSRV